MAGGRYGTPSTRVATRMRVVLASEPGEQEVDEGADGQRVRDGADAVAKGTCGDDGRGAAVFLTPLGRQVLENAAPLHVKSVRRHFIDPLSPEEIDQLAAITAKMLDHLAARATSSVTRPAGPLPALRAGGEASRPKIMIVPHINGSS